MTFDWKINVTAALAFCISVSALILQLMGYWKGASVTLHPAEKLYINSDNAIVRIGTRMVYTNDGDAGYNALILKESVFVRFDKEAYEQWAEERGTFNTENGVLVLKSAVDASPFIVPAMQLVSHEAYFAAREDSSQKNPWKSRITQKDFVQLLEAAYGNGVRTVEFEFQSISRAISGFNAGHEKSLKTTCLVTLDKGLIDRMKNEGWISRSCQNGVVQR
jgi:hypothetical protein